MKSSEANPAVSDAASLPKTLRLTLTHDLAAVPSAARRLQEFLEQNGVPEADANVARLAFGEAANNAIQYAPLLTPAPVATIQVERGGLLIAVEDHNPPFRFAPPPVPPSADAESGRGHFLIAAVMDSVEYRREGGANMLRMRKRTRTKAEHSKTEILKS